MAIAIILLWLGAASLWIALTGINAEDASPQGWLRSLGNSLKGENTADDDQDGGN